jgi:lipopolysaccharide/colanic/teichoic acid biosynthesis glycosyltransferase
MTADFHVRHRPVPVRTPVLAMPARIRVPPRAAPGPWLLAVATDLTALSVACAGYALWNGATVEVFGTATTVATLTGLCILLAGAWDRVGVELAPLLRGFVAAATTIAVLSLAIESVSGRTWVFGALPVACALAVAGRLGLRPLLRQQAVSTVTRVLAVGNAEAVASLVERVRRAPHHGWQVVGACTPTGSGPGAAPTVGDVPVVGDLDSVPRLARSGRFDTISVAPTDGWSIERLRRLVPHLEGSRTELVVDPGLAGRTGAHTRLHGVDGLQLLRLDRPVLPTSARALKAGLDRTAALLLLALTAPLLLVLAFAVWRGGGPVIVRDARLDERQRVIRLLRFGTTGPNGGTTRFGHLMRQHGLDGLPQLLNVCTGSLALVGPRPPTVDDVASGVRQPPLVAPGLTGLDGEGWVDDVELESRYVDLWSPVLDLRLLARSLHSAATNARR